jgi:Fe-S cluster assembly scaffold protein SufB
LKHQVEIVNQARKYALSLTPEQAARDLKCDEEVEEFMTRLQIIDRMGKEEDFCKQVITIFN